MRKLLLLLMPVIASAAFAQREPGVWRVERDPDETTGQETVSALVSGPDNKKGVAVRCRNGKLSVMVGFSRVLSETPPVRVTYRFDRRDYQYEEWGLSVRGNLAFAPDPLPLARQLARRSEFFVEVLNENGYPHQATFPLTGSATAIREVLAACPAAG